MRVLFVAHTAHPDTLGGACKSLLALVSGLAETVEPLVACPCEGMLPALLQQRGFKVVMAGRPEWQVLHPSPTLASQLIRNYARNGQQDKFSLAVRKFMPHAVHINSLASPREALLAHGMGIPVVWHIREILPPCPGRRDVLQMVHHTASKVLVISKAVERTFLEEGISGNIELMYNGIQPPSRQLLRKGKGSGRGHHPPVVGFVGTIAPHKGIDYFVHMAAIIHKQFPAARFIIAGHDWGTGHTSGMLRLVRQLDLTSSTRFLGFQVRVEEVLAGIDVLVIPSVFQEPFGRVAVEAMMMEKPVVATAVGGLTEIVVPGVTGWLVPARNAGALAERVLWLLQNPPLAKRMGARGRARAVANFLFADQIRRLAAIYHQLCPRQ